LCGESGEVIAEELEEGLQAALESWYRELTTHIKQERPNWEEFAYNSLLTAITTVLLEGKGAVKSGKTSVDGKGSSQPGGGIATGDESIPPSSPDGESTSLVRGRPKVGWDGRAVVKDATGPSITVNGVKYEFLGYDENGSPVYQDAEVLREQAARGKEAADQSEAEADEKTAQTENNKELSQSDSGKAMEAESLQDRVEKNEDRDILTLSTRYLNKNDSLYEYSKKIKPLDGFEDVVTHGDPVSLVFKDGDGKESNVSAEEFVKILKSDPNYKGGNVRLVACQVAADGGAIPKYIAKELDVTVIAPTESVNVDWDGNMFLADERENIRLGIQTGEWLVFEPGKEGVSYDIYRKIR